ncbi:MAG: flagellar basal-body MS-ring/collar protein FliF [Mariprofundus sp.]
MADALMPQNQQPTAPAQLSAGAAAEAQPIGLTAISGALVKNRKLLLFIAASLMLVGFVGLMVWSADTPYRPLYSGMNEKDSASIVELLQKEHIPYRLEGSGTVLVPVDQLYSVRLKLASQDMMPGSGSGFEIFDKSNDFGISDFTQKVNLQRAMQGEIARTIEVLPQVTAARVHLVLPKESAFAERDRKASASVMLQMMGNQRLPKQSVTAIQNLVAASVPELERTAVTVVDSSGNQLSGHDEEQPSSEGQSMQEYQTTLERRLEERLTTMMEQVVGSGQAVVRVTADINREYVEQNSQRYNPDEQVVRSEKLIEESRSASDAMPKGVPGVASNTPGANPAVLDDGSVATPGSAGEQASRTESTQNFEISSTTERKIIPFGSINKLSVAVIVGGRMNTDEAGNESFAPRGKPELNSLKSLVERAIGYDEDRGDSVEIQSMPLLDVSSNADIEALNSAENKVFYLELARYGVAGLALLLLGWFLLRPLSQRLSIDAEHQGDESHKRLPSLSGDAYARLEQMEKTRSAVITNPDRASKVLSQWVGP